MAVDVSTQITIGRSPEIVAAFAADPSNAPRWYVDIDSVEWQTPPPLAVPHLRDGSAGRAVTHRPEPIEAAAAAEGTCCSAARSPAAMSSSTYEWFTSTASSRYQTSLASKPG